MDQSPTRVSVLDVGTPSLPLLLTTGMTTINLYSAVVVGDRIYGPGTNGDYAFMKWSPTAIGMVASKKSGTDRGGYCTYQSGFAICGQSSEGYKKWDLTNEANITQVGHGTDPNGVGGDFDFATIFGNLVYLGNDHGSGAALIPHQMAPDTTAPTVVKVFPNDQDVKQPLSSRVTLFVSEDIDLGTVNPATVVVRKAGSATPLDGVLSKSSFNAISFGARAPLEANTTYEVVVPAAGLKDLVGNPIATGVTSRFSTGATITAVMTGAGGVGLPAGTGGAPGAGGRGAGGSAVPGTGGGASSSSGGTTVVGSGGAVGSASGGAGVVTGSGGTTTSSVTGGAIGSSTGGSGVTAGSGGAPGATTGGGGCACSVPAGSSAAGGMFSLVAAGLWLTARRSRRLKETGRDDSKTARS
jgi:hypothetical protein